MVLSALVFVFSLWMHVFVFTRKSKVSRSRKKIGSIIETRHVVCNPGHANYVPLPPTADCLT